eukprot:TRINITY_DN78830_c0_g1_i1.p1 TRINITY_DN78830_c0_g1~~TRINITY_DN78830_c0_g1_i1.p1  ORF type:complete len:730 (+),score=118.11 TRINITY_DN78830_c0_g1_i1:44-2191(+)
MPGCSEGGSCGHGRRRTQPLAVASLLFATAVLWPTGFCLTACRGRQGMSQRRIICRSTAIARQVPRPRYGPRPQIDVKIDIPKSRRPHVVDGADRKPGPIRPLSFEKSVMSTLDASLETEGYSTLRGRYAAQIAEHLAERRGMQEGVTVFWDLKGTQIPEAYELRPRKALTRILQWVSGIADAPVTRVESVEVTRWGEDRDISYKSGKLNYYTSLRQIGGVVHRTWPPMTDDTAAVIFERFRNHLDRIAEGGPKSIFCLISNDEGFTAMVEAAQSEGVTVITVGHGMRAFYYPGGYDFSIPIKFPRWMETMEDLLEKTEDPLNAGLDPFRPDSEWLPEHGIRRWYPGSLQLTPFEEEEVLDKRVFHRFLLEENNTWMRRQKLFGRWVRPGIRLNDTLEAACARALKRTGQEGTEEGPPTKEAQEIMERDLADLRDSDPEDYVALFWNYHSHVLLPRGPTMREMLARILRWYEGFLGMRIRRAEVGKLVEPWDRLGAQPIDWFYQQSQLDFVTHRIWPPKGEAVNDRLTRSIAAIAKAKKSGAWGSNMRMERPPRLVVVLAEDLCYDQAMNDAQDAGISALWLGRGGNGTFYPANMPELEIPINILKWSQARAELTVATNNPYLPGVSNPDAPLAEHLAEYIPKDFNWGKPDELLLDNSDLASALAGYTERKKQVDATWTAPKKPTLPWRNHRRTAPPYPAVKGQAKKYFDPRYGE